MKAAIMQPTYLPWVGYFDLMDQSDVFVYLDCVQFEKRSWQQRNRIKTPQGELYLTVPVLSKNRFFQRIDEVEIDAQSSFIRDHLRAVESNYGRAPYFKKYFGEFSGLLGRRHAKLVDLNCDLLEWFKNVLNIKTKTIRSSALNVSGQKTALLVDICKTLHCDQYLSAAGSKVYIDQNNLFLAHNIALEYHRYEPVLYPQLFGGFIPYLSMIDLLFYAGDESLAVIRSGRQAVAGITQ